MGGTGEFGSEIVSQVLSNFEPSVLKAMQNHANVVKFVGQCRVRYHLDGSQAPDGLASCFFVDWFGEMKIKFG
jgi:hypothetical protein